MMVEMMPSNQPHSSWVMPKHAMKIDGNKSECALNWIDSQDCKRNEVPKRLKRCLEPMTVKGIPGGRKLLLMVDLVYPVQRPGMKEHMRYVEPHII